MTESLIDQEPELWLERRSKRYLPGDIITGKYSLANWINEELQAIELTLLWYTAGQGEEDFCVHSFQRHELNASEQASLDCSFESVLPASPLSYDGQIVKVCWAVRLKGFFKQGRTKVVEVPFWLTTEESMNEPTVRGKA